MNAKYLALLALPLSMITTNAEAIPITGEVSFNGGATIDFAMDSVDITGNTAFVNTIPAPTGTFDLFLNPGDAVDYYDFSYNPADPEPDLIIWEGGGLTFTLDRFTFVDESEGLVLEGTGWVSALDFETTEGNWSFSADQSGTTFQFSSGTSIPEPGSLALLGLGLVGWAGWNARRKIQAHL